MTPSARDDLLGRAVAWFAEHGIGDTSLRTLAAGIGTSHRMLNYHFGSRAGLLAAVVEAVEREDRAVLERLLTEHSDPFEAGAAFWAHVSERATTFGPLFFELSSHAMRGESYAASLRTWLGEGWQGAFATAYEQLGLPPGRADALARISVALARGLILEAAVTGDRTATDRAMEAWSALVAAEARTARP